MMTMVPRLWPVLAVALTVACRPQGEQARTALPADTTPAETLGVDSASRSFVYDQTDNYIGARFDQRHGAAPGLAWIVPPHRLLTLGRHPGGATFGDAGFERWTYEAALDSAQAQDLRRLSVANDVSEELREACHRIATGSTDSTVLH